MQILMFMLDGGLFGGRVHTVWYFQRQPFSIKNISICIQMRCQRLSENLQPKTGFLSLDYSASSVLFTMSSLAVE